VIDGIVAVGLTGLVVVASLGIGLQILPRLGFEFDSTSESFVFSSGVGFALLILAMLVLGVAQLLIPAVAWVFLLASLGFAAPAIWRVAPGYAKGVTQLVAAISWLMRALLLVGLLYASSYLLVSILPILDGDSLFGYLLLPREYALNHDLSVVDHAYGYYYPQNAQLVSALGFLLHGEELARLLVSFTMGALASVAIYSMGRAYFGRDAGIIASVGFYGMFTVGFVAGTGKIDLAWAFFDILGIFAFSKWYFSKASKRNWLILAGAMVGVGIGMKYSSVFTIFAIGVALLGSHWVRKPTTFRGLLQDGLAFGIPMTIGALWLIRTFVLTGNPVYPMFNSVILGDAAGEIGKAHSDNIWLFPKLLWDVSMGFIAGGFGKPIGPMMLASIPLLMLFRGVDRRIKLILVFCGLAALLWFFGVQRPRHLLSMLALLSIVSGYVTVLLLRYRALGVGLVALMLIVLGMNWVLWARNQLPTDGIVYAAGLQSREEYLDAKIGQDPWYPDNDILSYVNEDLPPGTRLIGVPSSGAAYYIDPPIYQRSLGLAVGPQETLCDLQNHDITHAWVNFGLIEILEAKGKAENWTGDAGFRDAYLIELHANPAQTIYRVNYPDGLDWSGFETHQWIP